MSYNLLSECARVLAKIASDALTLCTWGMVHPGWDKRFMRHQSVVAEEEEWDRPVSFLQAHYNRFRDAGGAHSAYVVQNDVSADAAMKLSDTYVATQVDKGRM